MCARGIALTPRGKWLSASECRPPSRLEQSAARHPDDVVGFPTSACPLPALRLLPPPPAPLSVSSVLCPALPAPAPLLPRLAHHYSFAAPTVPWSP